MAVKAALALLVLAGVAQGCIFKYGTSPDSLKEHTGVAWDHGMNGDDWTGTCASGKKQSPLNIPTYQVLDGKGSHIDADLQTRWSYSDLVSNGSNVEVINTGHTIQVEWLGAYDSDVKIAVPANADAADPITSVLNMTAGSEADRATAVPLQFHFHALSEHVMGGVYYPLELHIVHRVTDPKLPACAGGCFTVTGILFKLTNNGDNPLLDAILDNAPQREGAINYLPAGQKIELGKMLPAPEKRSYVSYEGSLTTPPCSEGLLWHVLTTPQTISHSQLAKYHMAVGFKDCHNATANGTDHAHHHHRLSRRMLEETAEEHADPDSYTCKVVAYGYNYRSAQARNGRVVKLAKAAK